MNSDIYPSEGFYAYFNEVSQSEIEIITKLAGDDYTVIEIASKCYSVETFDGEDDAEEFIKKVEEEVSKL